MDRIYMGFSSSQHDPAVAIVDSGGEVVFAEANERSLKSKRAWNCVPDAVGVIEPLLEQFAQKKDIVAALTWSDRSLKWSPVVSLLLRLQGASNRTFLSQADKGGAEHVTKGLEQAMYKAPSSSRGMLKNLEYRLFEMGQGAALKKVGYDHHLCHAATAYYTSQFQDATCLIVDGMGESGSVSVYSCRNNGLRLLERSPSLDFSSLGSLYATVCWACGFDPIKGEEWKVMGLAAYGRLDESLYALIRPMLRVEAFSFRQAGDYKRRLSALCQMRGSFQRPIDAADLAHTGQVVFEEIMLELIRSIHAAYGGENLILSGGCALNSSCNGKILQQTPYHHLHVPMAPGDDGNAIGAALLAWQADHPGELPRRAQSPYLGSEISSESVRRCVALGGMKAVHYDTELALVERVSDELLRGKLVGWAQGRAEFGPRALGNRSILADPRNPEVKAQINSRVKFREEYRPFAPSVLHEHGAAYFKNYSPSPYMERALLFSDTQTASGVVHEDGTGRLQSVTPESNPRFHALLSAFHRKTGLPILLNTSFNVMGRPIIHDIEDAFGVFCGSGLDVLAAGNFVFEAR